jgi:hypothetical protein
MQKVAQFTLSHTVFPWHDVPTYMYVHMKRASALSRYAPTPGLFLNGRSISSAEGSQENISFFRVCVSNHSVSYRLYSIVSLETFVSSIK